MRYLAALAVILATIGTPALAADKGQPATLEQILSMADSTDRAITCHVGALGGFGIAAATVGDTAGQIPLAATGTIGALTGGCDMRMSKISLGVWGDYTIGDIKGRLIDPAGTADVSLGKQWAIGGRLGYHVQSSTMLFGALGYSQAEAKAGDMGEKLSGLVAGGGLETKIMGPAWFRFDAMRYFYGKDELGAGVKIDTTSTAVRAGVILKF